MITLVDENERPRTWGRRLWLVGKGKRREIEVVDLLAYRKQKLAKQQQAERVQPDPAA